MTKKILFCGNSHVGVFVKAARMLSELKKDKYAFDFCCAAGDKFNQIVYEKGMLIHPSGNFNPGILPYYTPIDYDDIFLVGSRNPLHYSFAHPDLRRKESLLYIIPPLSFDLLTVLVKSSIFSCHTGGLYAQLLNDFSSKIKVIPAPLPAPPVYMPEFTQDFDLGYSRYVAKMRELLSDSRLGLRVVLPPESLLTECKKYTRSEYNIGALGIGATVRGRKGDPHMNEKYGFEMLKLVLE